MRILWNDVVYVNSALSIIYECDNNSFPVCVCVWAECHFVLGEPAYDESHTGDGEA